MTIEGSFY